MNKKILIMGLAVLLGSFTAGMTFAEPDFSRPMPEEEQGRMMPPPPDQADNKIRGQHRPPSPEEFEKRLNLTEEQKTMAKTQREASIEKIKPILDKINAKKAEIEALQKTKMAQTAIDEQVGALQSEIRELRKQAHEIRKENMKAFEASLSDEQMKELQKMKEEGRRRFEERNKAKW